MCLNKRYITEQSFIYCFVKKQSPGEALHQVVQSSEVIVLLAFGPFIYLATGASFLIDSQLLDLEETMGFVLTNILEQK